jgi:hypothetical protein
MTGFPSMIFGLISIRSCAVIVASPKGHWHQNQGAIGISAEPQA